MIIKLEFPECHSQDMHAVECMSMFVSLSCSKKKIQKVSWSKGILLTKLLNIIFISNSCQFVSKRCQNVISSTQIRLELLACAFLAISFYALITSPVQSTAIMLIDVWCLFDYNYVYNLPFRNFNIFIIKFIIYPLGILVSSRLNL